MIRPDEDRQDILGTLEQLIGEELTGLLVEAFGGTRLFIASRNAERTKIATIVGKDAARTLSEHFRTGAAGRAGADTIGYKGVEISIPSGAGRKREDRRGHVMEMLAAGHKPSEVALATGVTERTVYRIRRKLRLRAARLKKRNR